MYRIWEIYLITLALSLKINVWPTTDEVRWWAWWNHRRSVIIFVRRVVDLGVPYHMVSSALVYVAIQVMSYVICVRAPRVGVAIARIGNVVTWSWLS